ncbi:MAG: NAD-binding protein [Spirochaetaceae bacterium]
MHDPRLRFLSAFALILVVVGGGTVGYTVIEGWTVSESLYMAMITLTTVGFGEVRPLSTAGRHFTIIYLILSVATVGYAFSSILSYLFEGQVLEAVKERRMKRNLDRIKDHYIVAGCGDIGREVALEFRKSGTPFLVVDRDPEHSELAEDEEIIFVKGDATEEHVLAEGRIDQAKGLIAALPADADNVFVTLTARQMNPKLTIIAKASDESAAVKLRRAGATRVITPSKIAGRRIASSILRPSVINFLDVIVDDSEVAMRMEEFIVTGNAPLVDKTLREADIGQHTGAIVLAITDEHGRTRTDATRAVVSTVTVHAGNRIIALGSEQQLRELEAFLAGKG